MYFRCKALTKINLIKENQVIEYGQEFVIEEKDRLMSLVNQDAIDLVAIDGDYSRNGNEIVIYADYLAKIGGIETAVYRLAQEFKDRNITFIFNKANIEQVLRVAQYRPVIFDDHKMDIKGDVVILEGYNAYKYISNRVKGRKIYQRCHADWETLNGIVKKTEIEFYKDMTVLAGSEQSQKGLLPIKSINVPVIPPRKQNSDFRLFLTLSRLSGEKGGKYIISMAKRFLDANKSFLWLVCGEPDTQLRQMAKNLPIVFLPPKIENEKILKNADYLVQMSDSESYCYSVHTALANGIPCLCSDIEPFMGIIKDGENGYIVERSMNTLDIEKIFNNVPKFKPIVEKISPQWQKVLDGEL